MIMGMSINCNYARHTRATFANETIGAAVAVVEYVVSDFLRMEGGVIKVV